MRITPDTNILVRLLAGDQPEQNRIAAEVLAEADLVVLTLPALCELAWVLTRSYRLPTAEVAHGIRDLIDAERVAVDRPAVEAGLDLMRAGGDFADGVIAYEGRKMGGEVFVSFDQRAVRQLLAQGRKAKRPT